MLMNSPRDYTLYLHKQKRQNRFIGRDTYLVRELELTSN